MKINWFWIILAVVVIPTLVGFVTSACRSNITTDSLTNFKMRMTKYVVPLGVIDVLFFGFCLVGSTLDGEIGWITTGVFSGLILLGLVLIVSAVPGFWENEVKDDLFISKRFWIVTKTFNIKDITEVKIRANQYGGSLRVYINNKQICMIDLFQENCENFLDRMEKEGLFIEGHSVEKTDA